MRPSLKSSRLSLSLDIGSTPGHRRETRRAFPLAGRSRAAHEVTVQKPIFTNRKQTSKRLRRAESWATQFALSPYSPAAAPMFRPSSGPPLAGARSALVQPAISPRAVDREVTRAAIPGVRERGPVHREQREANGDEK